MGRIIISLLVYTSMSSIAFAKGTILLNHQASARPQLIDVDSFNGITVDSPCLKNKKKCLAIKALRLNKKLPPQIVDHQGYQVNPASILCKAVGGKNMIASDLGLNQFDICLFEDKSFFFSFDYWKNLK